MSSYLSYELLVNLKNLDIISIRQSSFFQIRVTVYQAVTEEVRPMIVRVQYSQYRF